MHLVPAISEIPGSRWIVGVSGGPDSVGLVRAIAFHRPDLNVIVGHLDHEARGEASDGDARFVEALGSRMGVEVVIEKMSCRKPLPIAGREAAYRTARHDFFGELAAKRQANGVLLAHHADDRAETVLLRLLRGGEAAALGGLRRDAVVATSFGQLRIHRPLLGVRRAEIEAFLNSSGQSWREDATNAAHDFARNRVRSFLKARPALVAPLLKLADAADGLRDWTRANTPNLAEAFAIDDLGDLPDPLARAAGRRWLIDRGSPADEASAASVERLIEMCRDRATAGRRDFPGDVRVQRRGRIIRTRESNSEDR